MKKLLFTTVIMFVSLLFVSSCREQSKEKDNTTRTVIKGKIIGTDKKEIALNVYDKYSPVWKMHHIYTEVGENGNFEFDVETYNMAYATLSCEGNPQLTEFYLIADDTVEITINYKKGRRHQNVTFDGKNKVSHQFFVDYYHAFPDDDKFYECYNRSYDYEKCKQYWNDQKKAQLEFLDDYSKKHQLPEFVIDEINNKINYEWAANRTYFILFYYYLHPDPEPIEFEGYDYDYLNEVVLNNDKARYSMHYRYLFRFLGILYENQVLEHLDSIPHFDVKMELFFNKAAKELTGISRDLVIANRIVKNIEIVNDEAGLNTIKKMLYRFAKISDNSIYYRYAMDMYKFKLSLSKGNPAYDFKLNDINGNEVSLSDFRGKIVYIDIWEIGCSTCMTEIPYSLKLHKNLDDVKDDIVFLSINTNVGYPEQVKNFVKKWKILGTHLLTTTRSIDRLKDEYMYSEIPHYILIDRDGKFIDANMSRPSNPKTEKIIRKAIESKSA